MHAPCICFESSSFKMQRWISAPSVLIYLPKSNYASTNIRICHPYETGDFYLHRVHEIFGGLVILNSSRPNFLFNLPNTLSVTFQFCVFTVPR